MKTKFTQPLENSETFAETNGLLYHQKGDLKKKKIGEPSTVAYTCNSNTWDSLEAGRSSSVWG